MNIFGSGKPRETFKPHIQRRFPINPAVFKMLWSPRAADRKEGIRLLVADHPSREALQEHLRLRVLDRNTDVSTCAIKAAMERQVFDPITAANIFKLSDVENSMSKDHAQTAKDYTIALLPFSQYGDAVRLLRSSMTFDLKQAFDVPAKRAGIRLSPEDWCGVSFTFMDITLLFRFGFCPPEALDPTYIISKIRTGKRIEPSIYELSATQSGDPMERAAALALLKDLPKEEQPKIIDANISSSQQTELLGLRDFMQNAERAWLRDNYTLPYFLFQDPNTDSISLFISAYMMLFQRSIARGYCMHLTNRPIKPVMLLYLSALDNEIRSSGEAMRQTLEHVLSSDEYIPYLQSDENVRSGSDTILYDMTRRASLLKAMTGSRGLFIDKVIQLFNSGDITKVRAALDIMFDVEEDMSKVIGPYVRACFGEKYDYVVVRNAISLLDTYIKLSLPEPEVNNIRRVAIDMLRRHPEFLDEYLDECDRQNNTDDIKHPDHALIRHKLLCQNLIYFYRRFGQERSLLKQVRDMLAARCRKNYILAAIDEAFESEIERLDHPNRSN